MSIPVGTAAALDERAAARAHYEALAAEAAYPKLLVLLKEARAALPPEYCGFAGSLAGRIDDVLFSHVPEPVADDLVMENYGAGFGWFRRSVA